MRNFRNLIIWQKSHELTLKIYSLTKHFPKEELYGLTSQIRRSAISIPSNIAEGCGRNSEAELARFMTISIGSLSELDYQLFLASQLSFIDSELFYQLEYEINELRKMMYSFTKKLK